MIEDSDHHALWAHFLRRARHEIRAPLSALSLVHDVLAHGGAPEIDLAALLKRNNARLNALMERMTDTQALAFAAAERAPVVLRDLLARTRLDEVALEIAPDLPDLIADPYLLRIIFEELLTNAARFHRPETPARARITPASGSTLAFDVSDWGIGVDAAHWDRALDCFTRLHPFHIYGGTGLGLFRAARAAELLGGQVRFIQAREPTVVRVELSERCRAAAPDPEPADRAGTSA